MLHILFRNLDNSIYHPPTFFDLHYELEWLRDPLVRQIIEEVDGSTFLSETEIYSNFSRRPVSFTQISGGSKTLILLHKGPQQFMYNITSCGANCVKFIKQIAKEKDLYVELEYLMELNPSEEEPFYCLCADKLVTDGFAYLDAFCRAEEDPLYYKWDMATKTFSPLEDQSKYLSTSD